jgi:hypothetical protein
MVFVQVLRQCGLTQDDALLELKINFMNQSKPVTADPGAQLHGRLPREEQQPGAEQLSRNHPPQQKIKAAAGIDLGNCARQLQAAADMLNPEPLARLAAKLQQPGLSDVEMIRTLHQYNSLVQEQIAAADAMAERLLQQLTQAQTSPGSSPQYETEHADAYNADHVRGSASVLPAMISRQAAGAAARALIGEEQQLPRDAGAPESTSADEVTICLSRQQQQQENEEEECADEGYAGEQVWMGNPDDHHHPQRGRAVGDSLPSPPLEQQQQHQNVTMQMDSLSPKELLAEADAVPYKENQRRKLKRKSDLARGRSQSTSPAAAPPPAAASFNMGYGAPFPQHNPVSGFSFPMLPPAMILAGAMQAYGNLVGGGVQGLMMSGGMLGPWPGNFGAASASQVQGRAGDISRALPIGSAAAAGFGGGGDGNPAINGSNILPRPFAPADVTAEARGFPSAAAAGVEQGGAS